MELPGKLFGLHELKARGHRIELAERENIDGIQYYVLRLTLNDGYSTTLYVDPKTWLITRRRDVRPLHVDVDPTPTTMEQRSSDFRTISGVQFAFASSETDLQSGKVLETTVVRSVKINPPLVPSIFVWRIVITFAPEARIWFSIVCGTTSSSAKFGNVTDLR